jgi:hypothetical protein
MRCDEKSMYQGETVDLLVFVKVWRRELMYPIRKLIMSGIKLREHL